MDLKTELLIPPDPLINFEIQKNYQNEPRLMDFILEIIYVKKRMRYM